MNIIIGLFLSLSVAELKAEAKIGYVDIQKALESTKAGKAAKKSLEKEIQKIQANIKKEEEELRKGSEDLKRKESVLSESVMQKQQAALQQKYLSLQQSIAQNQMTVQKKEQELTEPIVKKILEVASKIGKSEGYDLILQKSEMSVVWGKSSLDLTDRVIKEVDKKK